MHKKTSPWLDLPIGLGLSAAACLLTLWLQAGSFRATMAYLLENPALLVLNWLPMAAVVVILGALTGNVFWGGGGAVLLWGLLSYINLVKTQARGDPFVPGDVLLLLEGMEAVGSYRLSFPVGKLLSVLGSGGACVGLGILWKSRRGGLRLRLGCALVSAVLFALAVMGIYADKAFYEALPGPDRANVPQVFDTFGFPYAFLHNFNLYPVDRPAGYSQAEAEDYEALYRHDQKLPQTAPNILMVMCEAFTDLPDQTAFTYGEGESPIAFYNSLVQREDVLSGQMVVSNIGAGTANTEFDVLTGMMTNRIGAGTTSAFRVVHRDTDSIPRALAAQGYQTFFTHPGHNWFYNRQSVYSYLGIRDQMFNEVYSAADYKGNWISDRAFLEQLQLALEARSTDAPLFAYGVTIQNHQAYTAEKYGFLPEPVQTELPLSDAAQEALSVYFEGLRDSDRMLQELTAWLEGQQEPWLLVFFGDHQPNLGADFRGYRELGLYPENLDTAENRLSQYTVPWLMWGNSAFHETGSLPELEQTTLSSHYLGALTIQAAGFEGLDGYVDYLNDLRLELPVSSVSGYLTADGRYLEELPADLAAREELRQNWQYYRLKDQKE